MRLGSLPPLLRKYATLGALEPQFWAAFCTAVGLDDLIEKQFDVASQPEIIARVQSVLDTKPRDAWVEELSELDACFGPVNDLREAWGDPQARARDMIVEVPVGGGTLENVGNPVRFRGDEAVYRAAPAFGEHTEEELGAAGYDDEGIKSLREGGAI